MSKNEFLDRVKKLNTEYQKKTSSKRKGAPKETGSVLYKYASDLVNNRVLDLYLKALGITTLTPTTLVPLALVMGATTFSDTVDDILALDKRTNASTKRRPKKTKYSKDDMFIPILDDQIFGTYIKYAGAAVQLALSPFTLVPVGLAVVIYELFSTKEEQKGGGSAWVISQNSGGPINSPNIWANPLSSKFSAFGREMTPLETQAITGYPFQQPVNTLLTISPLPAPLDGLGSGPYASSGGRRTRRSNKKRRSNTKRRSKSRPKIKSYHRRSRHRSQSK